MTNASNSMWNEIGPRDHFCQFYDHNDILIDSIDQFIGPGLSCGESAIVIVTPEHLSKLNFKLSARGINVDTAKADNLYIPLDAEETLSKFMNKDWPDQSTFLEVIRGILSRAAHGNRRVRAFGEMVALLWAQGNRPATIRLEKLWNDLIKSEMFSLFCAYPREAFDVVGCHASLIDICAAHSPIISAGKFEKIGECAKAGAYCG